MFNDEIQTFLEKATERIQERAVVRMKNTCPVDTGRLRRSLKRIYSGIYAVDYVKYLRDGWIRHSVKE